MKCSLTVLVFVLSLTVNAQDNLRFTNDKQLHFTAGGHFGAAFTYAALERGNYSVFDSFAAPQMVMMFIGMGKEFYDFSFGSGYASWSDIAYNQIGCLTGSLIASAAHKLKQTRKKRKFKPKL
jgi:uncharacterized protein YfiM (DUF2279 family)